MGKEGGLGRRETELKIIKKHYVQIPDFQNNALMMY